MTGGRDLFATLAGADPAGNIKAEAGLSKELVRAKVLAGVDHRPSHMPMSRRNPRATRLTVAVAVACCGFVVAVTSALGLPGQIVDFFSGAKATSDVSRAFADLPIGAPAGTDPRVDEQNVRQVTSFTSSVGDVILWAGPAENGYCYLFTGLTSGCRQTLGSEPRIDVSVVLPSSQSSALLVLGNIDSNDVDRVDAVYADGSRQEAEIVRVSSPIGATFFLYEVPRDHWAGAVLPSYVIGSREGSTRVIRSSGRLNTLSARDLRILHALATDTSS